MIPLLRKLLVLMYYYRLAHNCIALLKSAWASTCLCTLTSQTRQAHLNPLEGCMSKHDAGYYVQSSPILLWHLLHLTYTRSKGTCLWNIRTYHAALWSTALGTLVSSIILVHFAVLHRTMPVSLGYHLCLQCSPATFCFLFQVAISNYRSVFCMLKEASASTFKALSQWIHRRFVSHLKLMCGFRHSAWHYPKPLGSPHSHILFPNLDRRRWPVPHTSQYWISEQQYFIALIAWNNIQIPLSINSKHCECHQRTLIESLIGVNIRCSHYAHQGANTLRCESLPAVEVHFDQHAAVYGCNNRHHLYNNDEGLVKGMEKESKQPGPNPPPEKNTHKVWGRKTDTRDEKMSSNSQWHRCKHNFASSVSVTVVEMVL